jgi:hypothetical protein
MSYGAIRVFTDLNIIKKLLLQEGFYDAGILQNWKEGQVFGLAKPLENLLEVHIRGYLDNTLDAEVELSREYLEHPYEVRPFYGYLINILGKYNIPYKIIKPLPRDPQYVSVPKSPTKWKPLIFLGIGIIALIGTFYLISRGDEDSWRI